MCSSIAHKIKGAKRCVSTGDSASLDSSGPPANPIESRTMNCLLVRSSSLIKSVGVAVLVALTAVSAQPNSAAAREFPPGALKRLQDLPPGRLRTRIEKLPQAARDRAVAWLQKFHFTDLDLNSLEADTDGGIYYSDAFSLDATGMDTNSEPVAAQAAVPVSPFPASLAFHSKPGSSNVLFLNFAGEVVSNTAWNNSLGRTSVVAVAFSTDADDTTFSDAEQVAIKRIWQRIAEDYMPFDMDVTTERPAVFGPRTAHALITRSTDSSGAANPSSSAGGVGYVDVFGTSYYAKYRPAWIYFNNLSSNESFIAEAASHEIGHNLGLSHDGKTDGTEYYGGHGTGNISWGPIMGTGYNRNVSQWSKGDYYLANNLEDDLDIIGAHTAYRQDDHGDTPATATPLFISGTTNVVSTTPETDPANANPSNKGILERNSDVDVFSFTSGTGPVNLTINPWIMPSGTRGGNLDLSVELRDANGTLIQTNNPDTLTTAQIQAVLNQGVYYLYVRNAGVGDPLSATPSGYSPYGSVGQYFISGTITPSGAAPSSVQLTAVPNNSAWGSVTPTTATYSPGSTAQLIATAKTYYRFLAWTNGLAGTNDHVTLVLSNNTAVQALFGEMLTTNHPTPYWWLAAYGFTNNFETASSLRGANGMPFWQSYTAGLNPNDPNSQLRMSMTRAANGNANVINWTTVTGRVYTVWFSTNLASGFQPLNGAANLSANVRGFTNTVNPAGGAIYYRLEVRKP
ncbi:MAG: hypothetical protein JWM16_1803 [Verrucomicrobiales bacterium]|nr:hypothetical protein [Verrucomicrobiales bacterium]